MAECSLLYEKETPRIFATIEAMHKMRYYIDNTDMEIGWLGYVHKLENNMYLIDDVFLLKQKVHSATTEIDPEALATMATELIKQGEEGIAKYNTIRMWGHSHVNMSTSASGQDDNQMKEFATSDFYIRLIGNKRGEWNVCLYDYINNILWSDLPLELWYNVAITNEELDKEIKDNVSKIEFETPTYNRSIGYNSNWYSNYRKNKSYFDDEYDYFGGNYGEYPTYGEYKSQADRLRDEKEKEKEEETPYEITGEPTVEDFRSMKRYYSSDEDTCLFMCTADIEDVKTAIYEDYGIKLTRDRIEDFMGDMLTIWTKRYSNKYLEEEENGK